MKISKKWINVATALIINYLIILVYTLMTKEVTAKSSIIMLMGLNNAFIFVLFLLIFPLEPDSPSNVGQNKLNGGTSNGIRKDTGRSQKKSCNKKATPKLRSHRVEE